MIRIKYIREDNEYRVYPDGERSDCEKAYFTDDLQDAIATGLRWFGMQAGDQIVFRSKVIAQSI